MGTAKIEVADLEPFRGIERTVTLSHHKIGDKGSVRIRLLFTPEIIVKARKNTSTFSTAGRAMTQIGHIPASAGKGVFHGVTGVFKRDKDRGSDGSSDEGGVPDTLPAGQASAPIGNGSGDYMEAAAFPSGNAGNRKEPGTLRVVVKDAKDMATSDIKPYVTLRVGDKEVKTKHVSKTETPEW